MKTILRAIVAIALLGGAVGASASENADSPSERSKLIQLWISTGDPTYARLAGVPEGAIEKSMQMRVEHGSLGD